VDRGKQNLDGLFRISNKTHGWSGYTGHSQLVGETVAARIEPSSGRGGALLLTKAKNQEPNF
ncbi:hypothetical protein, partial [Desmospora activa]